MHRKNTSGCSLKKKQILTKRGNRICPSKLTQLGWAYAVCPQGLVPTGFLADSSNEDLTTLLKNHFISPFLVRELEQDCKHVPYFGPQT